MKSVMSHNFSQIPKVEIPRSVFDRSHGHKTTFDADYLVPWFVDEVLPGDTYKCRASLFARMATQIVPVMDNIFLDTFFFYVPMRLLWRHWPNFLGEIEDPNLEIQPEYLMPTLASYTVQEGDLGDHMGLPLGTCNLDTETTSLPFRAYNLIWNEWFRDENLQSKVLFDNGDGPDNYDNFTLLKRGKRHDYFTSALPWPQKGPGVQLPLGTSAQVKGTGISIGFTDGATSWGITNRGSFNGNIPEAYNKAVGTVDTHPYVISNDNVVGLTFDGAKSGMIADLSNAIGPTINSMRQAFQLQRLYERDARGGSRLTEILQSHFGVTAPDFRLQRPEFLGSSSTRININPVQQTSVTPPDGTGNATPMGTLAAYGVAHDNNVGFTKSFVEHGYVIGLVNVRADLTYSQGLPRMFSRKTRFDHYWPVLAHLGEQEIKNKEIYWSNDLDDDEEVFGYQERYAEYRYFPSQITGKFRPQIVGGLKNWHLSQLFGDVPALEDTFITSNTDIDRVIAVTNQPHFLFDSHMELHCARAMPVYSVPGMIDHF